jgi:hypothetical protein
MTAASGKPVEIDGANFCYKRGWFQSYWNRGWVEFRYFWSNGQHTYV